MATSTFELNIIMNDLTLKLLQHARIWTRLLDPANELRLQEISFACSKIGVLIKAIGLYHHVAFLKIWDQLSWR